MSKKEKGASLVPLVAPAPEQRRSMGPLKILLIRSASHSTESALAKESLVSRNWHNFENELKN